jgi:flagellar hook-associated protein 1 FlgK
MSGLLGTALSGLMASQSALNTASHNIANANTVGYSRQSVEFSANPALLTDGGYVGQGVNTATVTRSYNQFITNQLTASTSAYAQANTLSTLAFGVDKTLSSQTTGLSAVFSTFSRAVTGVANDPTSIPARQAMLSAAGSVTQQVNSLSSQLGTLTIQTNAQVQASVTNINSYATSIATLNSQIVAATNGSTAGQLPNDLLDQRDALVAQIAQQANVSTITQSNGSINVYIGSGQSLVSGSNVSQLSAATSSTNPSNSSVLMGGQDISKQITGGELSGALNFQVQVLNPAQQQLGLVAVGFAEQFNTTQTTGYDLNGNAGTAMFNTGTPTVIPNVANTGSITATYDPSTLGQLTPSDYQLSYDGVNYTLTQLSNNTVTHPVSSGAPPIITGPGFDINVTAIQANDSYLIRPTFDAAKNMTTVMTDPNLIAAAATNNPGPPVTPNRGDNANALIMTNLGNTPVLQGGTATFNNAYNQLVAGVGNVTQAATINSTAQQAALSQATAAQQNLAGVNLDEEAANLVKYQQAYQAASQSISIARSLFTTLIGAIQ